MINTYTTMLDIFGEAGRISSMNYVFKLMQENGIKVDAATYISLMHWISSSGDVDGAVKMWQEMKYNGCNPTVVSYTAYLKILLDNKRVKEARDLYREMILIGISPTCHTYTVLMEYLVSAGKCEEAMEIFSKMQEAAVQPDKAACNILIQRCWKVLEIVKEMIRAGHSLGVYHGALVICRLGRARRPTLAAKIFNSLPDQQTCTATDTALISVHFFAGSPDKALKLYKIKRRRCIHTAVGTYNVLLTGLGKSGKACETDTYRKENKRLQVDGASRNSVPMDEKICDLLFAGFMA
ncbi:hypothetical protein HS088_TW01G00869 [Tripterygium wilfordii]|uniref:PROP1-like PPR domain-containing protein n=1 Tax=Tripterygium wilfordii TaxID=458696 RepID=A0A7J7E354_TRIWF|nr:hypothetical protein HS088_TW01G00869 [Tripterygium wilfordii]